MAVRKEKVFITWDMVLDYIADNQALHPTGMTNRMLTDELKTGMQDTRQMTRLIVQAGELGKRLIYNNDLDCTVYEFFYIGYGGRNERNNVDTGCEVCQSPL